MIINIKKIGLAAWAVLFSVAAGVAMAEDSSSENDHQYCQLEAEEAGMIDEGDVRAYVDQCMEEIRQQNKDFEPDSGSDNSGSMGWE